MDYKIRHFLIFLVLVCVYISCPAFANSNDDFANAITISNINGFCSSNAQFDNLTATADGTRPLGWQDGPKKNVWFKFQATTNEVKIEVLSGGAYGTLSSPQIALFTSNQVELTSNNVYNKYQLSLSYNQLTIGSWYYFAVDINDPYNTNKQGTFTLCVDDAVSNDFKSGAIELTDLNGWCSGNAAFSNIYGTPDGALPQNWSNGPNYNVWFKFQATTTAISIELKSGGDFGTLYSPQMALYTANDVELGSQKNYNGTYLSISRNDLTPGDWYYFMVDVDDPFNLNWQQGTFMLCMDDEVNNDYKEGAIELTDIDNWCSGNAEFTNVHGTPDGVKPSGWAEGPRFNVWFKFQATTQQVTIDLKSGGEFGTLNSPQLALYDASGTELNSNEAFNLYKQSLSYNQLTVGNWYFFCVDNDDRYNIDQNQGTFTLCMKNTVSNDFKEGAIELTDLSDWTSDNAVFSNIHGTPDGTRPSNWNWGPDYNVWFKFIATTPILDIKLMSGGDFGTLNSPQLALFDSNGNELISGENYNGYNFSLSYIGLVSGQTYYFSVDVDDHFNLNYKQGTFTLSVNDGSEGNVSDQSEYEALVALYNSTNGSGWINKSGWLQGTTMAEIKNWNGIIVKGGDVVEIDLSGNNLSGTIPAEIGALKGVRKLLLHQNNITSVPAQLSELPKLRALDIRSNQLEQIPEELSSISSLEFFDVSDNSLSVIFSQYSGLTSMKDFRASGNSIASVPASLGDMTSLQSLDLSNNQFTQIPDGVGSLSQLRNLDFSVNDLSQLTTSIGNLTNLQYLDLSNNNIENLPSTISNAGNLTSLNLSNNKLRSFPASISTLSGLEKLDLSGNIIENIGSGIGSLTGLKQLYLGGENLTQLPPEIGNLSNLENLNIRGGQIQDIPSSINGLSSLRYLSLNRCGVKNLPEQMSGLNNLIQLNIIDNEINAIPDDITSLSNLKTLYFLNSSSLPVLSKLFAITSLEKMHVTGNIIEEVPESIGAISNLELIHLENNEIERLPQSIVQLNNLKQLLLDDNNIRALPENLNTLPKLDFASFTGNKLEFSSLEPFFNASGEPVLIGLEYLMQCEADETSNIYSKSERQESMETMILGEYTSYQWQKYDNGSWINIEGATNQMFEISDIQPSDAGQYRCKAINSRVTGLTLYSSPIFLIVNEFEAFYAISSGNWGDGNIWSYEENGTPVNSVPGSEDRVFIDGFEVLVTDNQNCKELSISNLSPGTAIRITGGVFKVYGTITVENMGGGNPDCKIQIVNPGSLETLSEEAQN